MQRKRYSLDLKAHMAECEANYARLLRLMPMLFDGDRSVFAMVLGESEPHVTLRIVARHKYTTVIELSQEGLRGDTGNVPETRLEVRVYHDAKSAEVITFQDQRGFRPVYDYPNQRMRHPDEKVQVNRFLGEFLNMCIAHGVAIEQPALADAGARQDFDRRHAPESGRPEVRFEAAGYINAPIPSRTE